MSNSKDNKQTEKAIHKKKIPLPVILETLEKRHNGKLVYARCVSSTVIVIIKKSEDEYLLYFVYPINSSILQGELPTIPHEFNKLQYVALIQAFEEDN